MTNNRKNYKLISMTIIWIFIFINIIWLINSIFEFIEHKRYLFDDTYSGLHYMAIDSKNGIVYSVIFIVSGIVISYFIQAFDDLIDNLKKFSK
jgi:hypothetical protein